MRCSRRPSRSSASGGRGGRTAGPRFRQPSGGGPGAGRGPKKTTPVRVRRTVLRATGDGTVSPALERASGKKFGTDFGVCSNPEFLREGSSIKDFYAPPFTLIGAHDSKSAEEVRALYRGIDAPVHIAAMGVAETVKYA